MGVAVACRVCASAACCIRLAETSALRSVDGAGTMLSEGMGTDGAVATGHHVQVAPHEYARRRAYEFHGDWARRTNAVGPYVLDAVPDEQ